MKDQGIIYVGVAIILLLLATSIFGIVSNSKNKRNLNAERVRTETLASEKAQLLSEIDQVKNDQTSLTGRYDSTQQSLANAESRIIERDRRINTLRRDNTALEIESKKLAELQTEMIDLDATYNTLQQEYEKSLAQNKELQKSLTQLEAQHKDVSSQFRQAELYTTDNFQVYGSRGKEKEKLTICARRTKNLNVNFAVPENLKDSISFTILTPAGETITPEDAGLSWKFQPEPGNLTAGLTGVMELENPRKVDLKYEAKEKLAKGEYKIQIFSNNLNIGNCRLRLR
jgi:myosin heavy subunit